MNPQEALTLTRMVAAICPQQRFDEFTPDAWGSLLEDVRFEDAQAAVKNLGRQQVFIAPSEILTEVRRIRNRRLETNPLPDPPDGLTVAGFIAWQRDTTRQIADGERTTTIAEINGAGQQRFRTLTGDVFQVVPE